MHSLFHFIRVESQIVELFCPAINMFELFSALILDILTENRGMPWRDMLWGMHLLFTLKFRDIKIFTPLS